MKRGLFSVLILALGTSLLFQNCSRFESSEFSSESTIAATSISASTVNVTKTDGLCNSVSFTQIPNQPDYFIGRVLQKQSSDPCDGTNWSLALFKMDWSKNNLAYQKDILTPPFNLTSTGQIDATYDPYIVQFNGEMWLAFECIKPGYTASSCVAPFTLESGIDTSRMTMLVTGTSNQYPTDKYSASVPKLLVFKGKLYLYWTVCKFIWMNNMSVLFENNTRGAELVQETSGSKRLWVKNSNNSPIASEDFSKSVEVFGATKADPSANSLADTFDFFTDGTTIYSIAGVGRVGCVTPWSPSYGCYRTRIASSTNPLEEQGFNKNLMIYPTLAANPQEYTRLFKRPDGSQFLMGQYIQMSLNGHAAPVNMIESGMHIYDFDPSLMRFAAIGTKDATDKAPTTNAVALSQYFNILQIFHSSCVADNALSTACNSAISRFCQTEGFKSGYGPTQHTGGNLNLLCLGGDGVQVLSTTVSILGNYNSQCSTSNITGDFCSSAVYRYCQAQGYSAGGFGPQEISGDQISVTCLLGNMGTAVQETFATLKTYHPYCNSSQGSSDYCRSATDNYCRGKGYVSSYGVTELLGENASFVCIKN